MKKIMKLLPVLAMVICFGMRVSAAEAFTDVSENMRGAVKVSSAVIYEEPSSKSQDLLKLEFGKKVKVKSESASWYEVTKGSLHGFMKKTAVVKYDKTKKHIALTFDDGPSAKTTGTVLKALEKNDCRATFFVVGSGITEQTGKLLKKEAALGCEIGNHSYSHPQLTKLSSSAIKSQLSKTDQKVKKYIGKKTTICRAPYGACNKTVYKAMGRPNIFWSVDTLDWKYRNTSRLISYVNSHMKNGGIILMHDIHKTTADAVDKICKNLKKKNFEAVTVTELSAIRGTKMTSGRSYSSF